MIKFIETKLRKKINVSEQSYGWFHLSQFNAFRILVSLSSILHFHCLGNPHITVITKIWVRGYSTACSTSRNTGTPEHRNTGTSRNIPEHPKNQEHPQKTRNSPKKTRNTPRKPGTPPRKPGTPPRKPGTPPRKPETPPRKPGTPRNLKKQMARARRWPELL